VVPVKPKRVLVVDDSRLMRRIYEVMLRDYPLAFAADGGEALTRLREQPDIDLVLLDLNMPTMDGRQFLAELRRSGGLQRVRVVIVTTEGRDEDARRGLEAGAAAYVRKPFKSEEIRALIAQLGEAS
jgi:CheY-like chemotaxis protein